MELIIHFKTDGLVDVGLDLTVKDMTVMEILAALGLAIIEIEKQYDVEIDAGLIEKAIRIIKDEQI